MIDDAHATGFLGKTGRGTHEYRGVMGRIDIITGTLGQSARRRQRRLHQWAQSKLSIFCGNVHGLIFFPTPSRHRLSPRR